MELTIGKCPDGTIFPLPNNCPFFSLSIQVPIETVFADIKLSSKEPLGKWRLPFQYFRPWLFPQYNFVCYSPPKFFRFFDRFLVERIKRIDVFYMSTGCKFPCGRKKRAGGCVEIGIHRMEGDYEEYFNDMTSESISECMVLTHASSSWNWL